MVNRLSKLKELEEFLRVQMHEADPKSVAAIAKQYRETIREIEEIEGGVTEDDEIGAILSDRKADGKSGAVRKSRARVSGE